MAECNVMFFPKTDAINNEHITKIKHIKYISVYRKQDYSCEDLYT